MMHWCLHLAVCLTGVLFCCLLVSIVYVCILNTMQMQYHSEKNIYETWLLVFISDISRSFHTSIIYILNNFKLLTICVASTQLVYGTNIYFGLLIFFALLKFWIPISQILDPPLDSSRMDVLFEGSWSQVCEWCIFFCEDRSGILHE